jgi:hypothetical protein
MPCHADLHHQRADSHRHDARQNEMKFIHGQTASLASVAKELTP